jgi:hypothetical protein
MVRIFTGVALLLCFSSSAMANIGPRWWGNYGSEPQGGTKEIDIVREDLMIDMRPLIDAKPASVTANYKLHNSGPARKLDLLFVAGSQELSDFEVRLGNHLLASRRLTYDEVSKRLKDMPEAWKLPKSMHGIEGATYPPIILSTREDAPSRLNLVAFTVVIPSGPGWLQARYRTRVAAADEGYPMATWQLPYIMAPAREWKSFGGLDVTVYLPDGWQHASTPTLERDGNVLRGSFSGLPADALVVSTRCPVGPELGQRIKIGVALFILAVLGGGLLCWSGGRWTGRFLLHVHASRGWSDSRRNACGAPWAIFLGLLWSVSIAATFSLSVAWISAYLGTQESPYFHEPFGFIGVGVLLLALGAFPAGALLAWKTMASRFRCVRECESKVT